MQQDIYNVPIEMSKWSSINKAFFEPWNFAFLISGFVTWEHKNIH